ncbi:MAG: 4-hydroxybenzoate octaprenyltransferase [Alphaproteobacteria bacterium]|nr:4-hydroxybenzoate octaprenyltransferase [Alphaproteobacteria bacterium]
MAFQDFVLKITPQKLQPYVMLMRLHQPAGIWLLMWPCWWGTALAAEAMGYLPSYLHLFLFFLGSVAMRGAGCTLNDIIDQKFDAKVERTRTRPLASGMITTRQAFKFLGAELAVGLLVLVWFNYQTILLGLASLALILLYPYMKRITYWPQLFLGFTFNWGALLGWTAMMGELSPAAYALYCAGIFWTLGYDTIYAHQDKEDDLLVGVKSTALKLGKDTKQWLMMFYGASTAFLALAGFTAGLGWQFYAALPIIAGIFYAQIHFVDLDNPTSAMKTFKSNVLVGALVFGAILLG